MFTQTKIKNCMKCDLYKYRRNVVIGRGSIPADVLFIGEAPDRSEDLIGVPCVGRQKHVLNDLISSTSIVSFYIINCILCRTTDSLCGNNRDPLLKEVLACTLNVMNIIKKVNPNHIVLLGKIAKKYYFKEFPDAICLQHPGFLAGQGGVRSPYYRVNLRRLKEGLKWQSAKL